MDFSLSYSLQLHFLQSLPLPGLILLISFVPMLTVRILVVIFIPMLIAVDGGSFILIDWCTAICRSDVADLVTGNCDEIGEN